MSFSLVPLRVRWLFAVQHRHEERCTSVTAAQQSPAGCQRASCRVKFSSDHLSHSSYMCKRRDFFYTIIFFKKSVFTLPHAGYCKCFVSVSFTFKKKFNRPTVWSVCMVISKHLNECSFKCSVSFWMLCRPQSGGAAGGWCFQLVQARAAWPYAHICMPLHQRPDEEETSVCWQGTGQRDAGAGADTEGAPQRAVHVLLHPGAHAPSSTLALRTELPLLLSQ